MEFACDRGRLPAPGELPEERAILSEFNSYRRAFQVITKITHPEEWEAIRQKRRRDLITYIAVSNFGRRHSLSYYSPEVRNDIKFLFPSYKKACEIAESLIFVLTDLSEIVNCCRESPVGLMMGKGFYIHISALNALAPLLRIYEGIVSRTFGRLDEATVIKFHTKSHKISYLYYPNFDISPHPALYSGMKIDLRDLRVTYYDYEPQRDPPILHSKERLVTTEYPHYEKFAKLTRQEKAWGLLDDTEAIITRKAFGKMLEANCAEIRNHCLSWRKDADPEQVKLVKAALEERLRG
jgi:DNA phosphorothioation-associated putative methyltransferase